MIGLKKLSQVSDGVQIMKFVSARQGLDKDPDVLILAKKLDGLPLALATAGAYLGETKITCKRYLEHYETAWVRLQTSSPRLLTYGDRAMYSTWRISYEQVKTENDNAAKLLKLWAYFKSADIWFELFNSAAKLPGWLFQCTNEEEEFHRTMGLLVKYGLVESPASDQEPGHARGYSMHECVHSWTRHVLNEIWGSDSARLALRCIASTVPESTIGPFFSLALRRAIYHATHYSMVDVRALLLHQGYDFELTCLARMCQMDGDYHTASDLYVMAFEGYERSVGLNDSQTNEALSRLGLMYLYQGKIGYAEQTIHTAFQRCASPDNLGPDNVFTLKIAMDLAGVYEVQGRVAEARKLYEDALEGFEANLGPQDDLTLRAVIFLASLCQGELERSEELFQRALNRYEKQRPRDERRIFTICYQLSDLYKSHGLLEKSEAFCQKALRGWEGLEGTDAPVVVNATYSLGMIYQQRRKLAEAKKIFENLIESSERLGFGEHNMILDVCCRLARILLEEGRPAEAESMCLRSLSGYEARIGFNSEDTLEPAILLGAIYHKLGRDEEAEAAYRRAYTACGEMWAGDRSAAAPQWAAMGFADYGDILRQRDDLGAAVKMYREMLAGVARFEGKDSDVYRNTETRIQKLEARLGKLQESCGDAFACIADFS
ncbi:hypothetical protein NLG97_g10234 [Lecanicillium saksenae]|uniref:Uncharacterized protein n=1 Tax=Lecanicillium saksenae TaxID=468837 RepID=A0ACC1QF89_9HYPO|nr:hypothetical protein NLG97_g10234 [Lecanicillium saksenae]